MFSRYTALGRFFKGCLLRLYGNGGKNALLYTMCSAKNIFLLFSILLIYLGIIKCSESLYLSHPADEFRKMVHHGLVDLIHQVGLPGFLLKLF